MHDTAAVRAEIAETYRRLAERSSAPRAEHFMERARHIDVLAEQAARLPARKARSSDGSGRGRFTRHQHQPGRRRRRPVRVRHQLAVDLDPPGAKVVFRPIEAHPSREEAVEHGVGVGVVRHGRHLPPRPPRTAAVLFPHAAQAIELIRRRRRLTARKWKIVTVYAITGLTAFQTDPALLARWIRDHWSIENRLHWVRDVSFDEDRPQIWTDHGPQVMAVIRNLAITALRLDGATNIAAALRRHARDTLRPLITYKIT